MEGRGMYRIHATRVVFSIHVYSLGSLEAGGGVACRKI